MIGLRTLIFMLVLCSAPFCWGQEAMVIVMGKDTPVKQLSKSEVIDIFMGKFIAYPSGELAITVEFSGNHAIKEAFYKQLINRSLASVNAYWARLKFSGRKRAVVNKDSVEEVISYLSSEPFAIGYIPAKQVTPELKVIYSLDE